MCRLAFKTAECCCVFERETGAKLIGFFYALLFFFGMLGPLIELNSYRSLDGKMKDAADRGEALVDADNTHIMPKIRENMLRRIDSKHGGGGFELLMILLILLLLVGIVVNVVMVWAVFIKFHWLLTPWLVFQVLSVILTLVVPIFVIYGQSYYQGAYGPGPSAAPSGAQRWTILLALVPIGLGMLGVYFFNIVKNLFNKWDQEKLDKVNNTGQEEDGRKESKNNNVFIFAGTPAGGMSPAVPVVPPVQPIVVEPTAPPKVID